MPSASVTVLLVLAAHIEAACFVDGAHYRVGGH